MTQRQQQNVPALRFPEFKGQWKEEKLGKEAVFSKGKGVSKNDIDPNGDLYCIRYGELYTDYGVRIDEPISKTSIPASELVLSEGGEVIVPASGEDAKDIATAAVVLRSGVALGGDLNIIKSPNNGHFLASYISGKKRMALARMAQGNSVVHLYPSQLGSLHLHFPKLEEQQRIAGFLEAVDEKIIQLARKKELLEDYKKGCMQKLFSQSLRFRDDNGKPFPDWEERKLGDLGGTYSGLSGKSGSDFGSGSPYVTYRQIFEYPFLDTAKCEKVIILEGERQNSVMKGDVLITISSETPNEVGYASAVTNEPKKVYLNSFCFGFRPQDRRLTPFFSGYLFRSDEYRRQVVLLAQGSTRYNISKSGFLKIKLSIPHPNEQRKIADFLSVIDRKIDIVGKELELARNFKQGLLQQMFV